MNAGWFLLALACLGATPVAAAAEPFASDWAISLKSRARLVADGNGQAGVEIELAPGAITYWRDPGEAGVPPAFDFSGSVNLKRAEAIFPAPKRIAETDGSEAFGYERATLFPIVVEALDPKRPVTLSLALDYAVCEKICLPARAKFALELSRGAATPFSGEVAAALARAPQRVESAAIGADVAALDASRWRLCLPASSDNKRDLFVEPPRGYWMTTAAEADASGRDCFSITLRERPSDAVFPISVTATIVGGPRALETSLLLAPRR